MTQPFILFKLRGYFRTILHRRDAGSVVYARGSQGICRFGGWRFEQHVQRLTDPEGNPVPLTQEEYALLIAFLEEPQRPLSREHLLRAIRAHETDVNQCLDVHILRLRRRLEPDPTLARIIQTERGVGYVFALRVESSDDPASTRLYPPFRDYLPPNGKLFCVGLASSMTCPYPRF
jgi:two-component system OmpR family response regulator